MRVLDTLTLPADFEEEVLLTCFAEGLCLFPVFLPSVFTTRFLTVLLFAEDRVSLVFLLAEEPAELVAFTTEDFRGVAALLRARLDDSFPLTLRVREIVAPDSVFPFRKCFLFPLFCVCVLAIFYDKKSFNMVATTVTVIRHRTSAQYPLTPPLGQAILSSSRQSEW